MTNLSIQNDLEAIKKTALIYDIETSASYPDGRPVDIKKDFESYIKYAQAKWFGCYSYKENKGYCLNVRTDFNKIFGILNSHDVLVGFNSEEFDFPILFNNQLIDSEKKYNQVDLLQILGTANQRNKDGYKFKNRAELMDVRLKNNHLRGMAEAFKFEVQKGNIDYQIFFKDEWTPEETEEIKKYLKADILITKQLFEKTWDYWIPFAELVDYKNIYNLSWLKSSIASLTYKAACKVLDTEPTYSESHSEKEEVGGNVLVPTVEEAYGIWYLDFASLYPHMFCMFNLAAEVDENDITFTNSWHGNALFKVKGYYSVNAWHPLSKYIADKLKERLYLKETDSKNPMVYTLKILLNGLYGVMRSAIFEKVHTPNCGADCCSLGQQMQKIVIDRMKVCGFESLYGDSVAKDTPILINYQNQIQLIPIEDLFSKNIKEKNVLVWTDKGWAKIKYIYKHKINKKMYRILTRKSYIEVSCDHSLIINNKKIKPSDLKIGDKIELFPNTLPQIHNIDKDLCWFLGFWLAEGTTGHYHCPSGVKYSWALNQKDNMLLIKAQKILLKYGLNTVILNTLKSSNCNKLVPAMNNNKVFYELFSEWCLSKSSYKKVPSFILSSNLESKKAFVDGYLNGDGSIDKKDKAISFCSIDKPLFSGLCQILTDLGEDYSLKIRPDKLNVINARLIRNKADCRIRPCNEIIKIQNYMLNDNIYDIETENHRFCGGIGNVNLHNTDSVMIWTADKAKNTREYVLECIGKIIDEIKNNVPFPVDTFKIAIEKYLEYIMFPFEEQAIVGEDGKNKKEGNRLILERKGKKKNYLYVYKEKDDVKVKLVGLPIMKDNATALGIKIYEEVLKPRIITLGRAKFLKSFLIDTINVYLMKPEIMDLIAVEFKVNAFDSYKLPGQIQAQISKGYFDGQEGTIRLIKNKKVGKAGKGMLYCTSEEAKEAHLTIDDLDLDKVWQELSPFIQYVTPEIKEACKILAKDDKALKKLADDYCNVEEPERLIVMPEAKENYKTMIESSGFEKGLIIDEPKKQRGRPKKNNE